MRKANIRKILLCTLLLVFALSLASCGKTEKTVSVTEDTEYGGVNFDISIEDFNKAGFKYGDSVSLSFSNGFELSDVPYYNGYYAKTGDPVVCAYQGSPVCFQFCNAGNGWEMSGCAEGDKVTVSLLEHGKYLSTQELFATEYSDERSDYDSDAEFANFRQLSGGKIAEGMWYRGASPVNNQYGRASYADDLIQSAIKSAAQSAGINFVLDLSDTDEKIAGYKAQAGFDSDYFIRLYDSGRVAAIGLDAAYRSDEFAEKLAGGIRKMIANDGPYYIHCTEGKDRTGFVCMLFEALAGASYDEIEKDYMASYANYFGITPENNPDKYNAIKQLRLDDMYGWLTKGGSLRSIEAAKEYLSGAGLTASEIAKLTKCLVGPDSKELSFSKFSQNGDIIILCDAEAQSMYLEFQKEPGEYTVNGKPVENSYFIQQYIEFDKTKQIVISGADPGIVHVFDGKNPPSWVHIWEPPCTKADLLLISSHADDEQLFFAGVLPYYSVVRGLDVQVAYATDHLSQLSRHHERLNGLWACGIRNYPVSSGYNDMYSEDYSQALNNLSAYGIDENDIIAWEKMLVNRFRPQIIVTHDVNGEYGHGMHKLVNGSLQKALSSAQTEFPFLKRVYFHLYGENTLRLDAIDEAFSELDGMTPFQVTQQKGFDCHKSQHWTWFKKWIYGPDGQITKASQIETYSPLLYGCWYSADNTYPENDFFEGLTGYRSQVSAK